MFPLNLKSFYEELICPNLAIVNIAITLIDARKVARRLRGFLSCLLLQTPLTQRIKKLMVQRRRRSWGSFRC